ncbi:GNAT family N-acetyltransferase [Roseicitreum antarcticum]|uniref:Protein N-acetyltransferase, RimJ/RimL family n=1 Tax=Roseicitreum antarcticum TaxID=564137 RepID=A0A1H2RUU8_9RHOB|nr:GNAT family N-acetyltransferase [Roseicitreum antarcticum]SDW23065.1 Protein N-acetyltransferase, RimJ/RimL family [Roseicitreum antarcticum]
MMPDLTHTPVLETPQLFLRAPRASDLPALVAYATGARTRFVGGPRDVYAATEKFAGMIGQWVLRGFGRFILTDRDSGAALGHAGPLQMDTTQPLELTWSLWDAASEGRGLASEAALATTGWVFETLTPTVAHTQIHRDNTASHAIARKLGGQVDAGAPSVMGEDFTKYSFTAEGLRQ